MQRNEGSPSLAIVDDDQLELEMRERADRAQEWAAMTQQEQAAAMRADRPAAEEARAAAQAEGLIE